jgi:SAM-dependent methyltransferase
MHPLKTTPASEVLETWIHESPIGRALDLGAGEGETACWLAERDFSVEAIERDPRVYEQLVKACAGKSIQPHLADILHFTISPGTYSLILAEAVLHFLKPTELWPFADHLCQALIPDGLLIAEVFTTDDPGFTKLCEIKAVEIEPNTFQAPEPIGLIHYFAPGELQRVFAALEILAYEESRRLDPTSSEGYRAGATLVGRRAT